MEVTFYPCHPHHFLLSSEAASELSSPEMGQLSRARAQARGTGKGRRAVGLRTPTAFPSYLQGPRGGRCMAQQGAVGRGGGGSTLSLGLPEQGGVLPGPRAESP